MDNTTSLLHAALLGLLQGLTEFLPVSSSAHLIAASYFMDGKPLPLELNVALHIGTLGAVLIYFWRDWLGLANAAVKRVKGEKSYESDVLIPALVIGSIPAGVLGILFNKKIEEVFHNPVTVIAPLLVVGFALWMIDKKMPAERTGKDIGIKDAFLIGIGQACALIPGFSRSGSTIIAGRLLKLRREDAARFSFILGTPAIGGAVLLEGKKIMQAIDDPIFYVGASVSFVTGCLCISFFLKFLRKFGFGVFFAWRAVLAVILLVSALSGG